MVSRALNARSGGGFPAPCLQDSKGPSCFHTGQGHHAARWEISAAAPANPRGALLRSPNRCLLTQTALRPELLPGSVASLLLQVPVFAQSRAVTHRTAYLSLGVRTAAAGTAAPGEGGRWCVIEAACSASAAGPRGLSPARVSAAPAPRAVTDTDFLHTVQCFRTPALRQRRQSPPRAAGSGPWGCPCEGLACSNGA